MRKVSFRWVECAKIEMRSINKQKQQFSEQPNIPGTVRDFYERHPYPPPVDNLDNYRLLWQDRDRRRADYHLFRPFEVYREDKTILIAGCGTSQAAKYALRWPEAKVTGIDFSATSVRRTEELKQKYNLNNLDVYQLPLERVSELGRSFDRIVCTGVVHHLADPDAGMRALRGVFKPDGAMHLMVYAPYGRTGIYMMQEYCRRLAIGHSKEDIRDLIEMLKVLPHGHPLERLLREAPDFRHEAGLADALLHPQDRAYSVPQFFDFLQNSGFKFGRWLRQSPYLFQCGELAKTAHADIIETLPLQNQYAALELFRGTMLRHSAVVYHNDRDNRSISFDDKDWLRFVPIRLPETISVKERLPPGATAVLINRNHTYTDIYLPINKEEELLYESIDGKRSIAKIMNIASIPEDRSQQRETVRVFFERLWRYDQIVFDASGANAVSSPEA